MSFVSRSLMEPRTMHKSRGDTCHTYGYPFLLSPLHTELAMPHEHKILVDTPRMEVSKTQSKYRVTMSYLRLSKQGH